MSPVKCAWLVLVHAQAFRNKDNHKGHGGHYGETGEDSDQFLRDRDRHLCQAVALRLPLPR